ASRRQASCSSAFRPVGSDGPARWPTWWRSWPRMRPTTSWDRPSPSMAVSAPPDGPARALLPRRSYFGLGGQQAHPRYQKRGDDRGFPPVSLPEKADDAGGTTPRIDDPARRVARGDQLRLHALVPARARHELQIL